MYGLKEIIQKSFIGIIISVVLCLGGFFAFFFHMHFIRKGRIEYKISYLNSEDIQISESLLPKKMILEYIAENLQKEIDKKLA